MNLILRAAFLPAILGAALLGGCAAFDGRGLEPGKARAADVEAVMGTPVERVAQPDGGSRLYFTRLPFGRANYVATIGPDGLLRGIEQQLKFENIKRIAPNVTTTKEVRELLGPPARIVRMARQQRDVWEYPWQLGEDRRILWVQHSYDGTVREVIEMHDYESDPPSGPAKD
jgi:hypothetical protein